MLQILSGGRAKPPQDPGPPRGARVLWGPRAGGPTTPSRVPPALRLGVDGLGTHPGRLHRILLVLIVSAGFAGSPSKRKLKKFPWLQHSEKRGSPARQRRSAEQTADRQHCLADRLTRPTCPRAQSACPRSKNKRCVASAQGRTRRAREKTWRAAHLPRVSLQKCKEICRTDRGSPPLSSGSPRAADVPTRPERLSSLEKQAGRSFRAKPNEACARENVAGGAPATSQCAKMLENTTDRPGTPRIAEGDPRKNRGSPPRSSGSHAPRAPVLARKTRATYILRKAERGVRARKRGGRRTCHESVCKNPTKYHGSPRIAQDRRRRSAEKTRIATTF